MAIVLILLLLLVFLVLLPMGIAIGRTHGAEEIAANAVAGAGGCLMVVFALVLWLVAIGTLLGGEDGGATIVALLMASFTTWVTHRYLKGVGERREQRERDRSRRSTDRD